MRRYSLRVITIVILLFFVFSWIFRGSKESTHRERSDYLECLRDVHCVESQTSPTHSSNRQRLAILLIKQHQINIRSSDASIDKVLFVSWKDRGWKEREEERSFALSFSLYGSRASVNNHLIPSIAEWQRDPKPRKLMLSRGKAEQQLSKNQCHSRRWWRLLLELESFCRCFEQSSQSSLVWFLWSSIRDGDRGEKKGNMEFLRTAIPLRWNGSI